MNSDKMSRGLVILEAAKRAASDNLSQLSQDDLEAIVYYGENQKIFTRRGKQVFKNANEELAYRKSK